MSHLMKLIAVWGFTLFAAGQAAAQDTVEYVHTDALGSPVAVTDQSGAVVWRATYEPYGMSSEQSSHDGPGYAGHVSDSRTELSYMQQRYYDPGLGRFLSVDPVTPHEKPGSSFNRYRYAATTPTAS